VPTDVLIVSLGSTHGWRVADAALAGALERAGASVAVVHAERPREVRTFALTDLAWALAARRAAIGGLREHRPRAVLYSTTTAALVWPRPGAIRFDALALENRPGRHGLWQRPVESRRLRQAPLLVPMSLTSGAPLSESTVIVPPPVTPSGPPAPVRDIAAITYASDPVKKGLDRVLDAWARARREGEELVVVTEHRVRADGVRVENVRGEAFRALVRRARVYVVAPKREDFGIAQLEALADGCILVTTDAPGPYEARELARHLDPRLVGDDLAFALRCALDDPDPQYAEEAQAWLADYRPETVDRIVAEQLLPRLLEPGQASGSGAPTAE
jgi:glycosyltransferase involved in cell wall biosynthesis